MEEKKVLLSVKDLNVKFQVRGRTLTALRGISLDIYENESIAIVGESGSGKSVFTQTFAGMLDANGYVDSGEIIFNDEELADTVVELTSSNQKMIERAKKRLDEASKLEPGAATWLKIQELEKEKKERFSLGESEMEAFEHEYNDLSFRRAAA
ncbi:MAG: ATP-binding cassette domain-containing protein [Lachnospiraceae bacterium]|nr:ATP-binding cassette domain-containing protein [Lachnospiraceae bacterium]